MHKISSPLRPALRSEFPAWRRRQQWFAAGDTVKRSLETLPCPSPTLPPALPPPALLLRHLAPTCAVPCTGQLRQEWWCSCSEKEAAAAG